ncbi:ERV/ALR sulfhydryl oxidase domain-containing protein [Syncephalis plumigaleata]|nr:ERV/ALR sulfhydryl oxidase domain-containing protein [Syncephalis plumigaleata]
MPETTTTTTDEKPCRVCTGFTAWRRKQTSDHTRAQAAMAAAASASESFTRKPIHSISSTSSSSSNSSSTASQPTATCHRMLYPCGDCADHLREEIRRHPPDVASRITLSEWLCQTHNEVNRRLGKPIFDCKRVIQIW